MAPDQPRSNEYANQATKSKTSSVRNLFIFLSSAVLLIALVLGFTGGLNITSFRQSYTESLVRSYTVAGQVVVRKIEYSIRYGKPLENYYGIDKLLGALLTESPALSHVSIVSASGNVIYDEHGSVNQPISAGSLNALKNGSKIEGTLQAMVLSQGQYNVFLPILKGDGHWLGSLEMTFPASLVTSKVSFYMTKLLTDLLMLAVPSLLILAFLAWKLRLVSHGFGGRTKTLLAVMLGVLGTAQLVFGLVNYKLFQAAYEQTAVQATKVVATVIANDINSALLKGVPYTGLHDMHQYLQPVIQQVPEISSIKILTPDLTALSAVDDAHVLARDTPYVQRLSGDDSKDHGQLTVTASQYYIAHKMNSILLDMTTVFVTSFLFMVEIALLVVFALRRLDARIAGDSTARTSASLRMIRPLAFTICFGAFMSLSFVPMLMKSLYRPIFGLPKDVVIALPVSAEMLFAGVATILAGSLASRHGWRRTFFTGALILASGSLLCAFADNEFMLIAGRAVAGAGYGTALIAMRVYASTREGDERSRAMSGLLSGMYAGLNSGVIVGAMLADRVGFNRVFLVAALLETISVLIALLLMENMAQRDSVQGASTSSSLSVRGFLMNRAVLGFFVFVLVPAAICSMFLDYYFPLYAAGAGISASNVGRAFLLNGLAVIYLGPWLGSRASRLLGSRMSILASGLLMAAAFVIFSVTGNAVMGFATVILLGVADSVALVAQNEYFVRLSATRTVGVAKALGYYGNIKKLGQMFGPMVFGALAIFGISGIGIIGVAVLVMLGVFLLVSSKSQVHDLHSAEGI